MPPPGAQIFSADIVSFVPVEFAPDLARSWPNWLGIGPIPCWFLYRGGNCVRSMVSDGVTQGSSSKESSERAMAMSSHDSTLAQIVEVWSQGRLIL